MNIKKYKNKKKALIREDNAYSLLQLIKLKYNKLWVEQILTILLQSKELIKLDIIKY